MHPLAVAFRDLPLPVETPDGTVMTAMPLPGPLGNHVAKTLEGLPVVLFRVSKAEPGHRQAPIVLEHVSLQHQVQCRIVAIGTGLADEGSFSMVRCSAADPELELYFLTVMSDFAACLPAPPTQAELGQAFGELAQLFAAMTTPARTDVRALWAELLLVTRSRNKSLALLTWRNSETDRYDFAHETQRIEVKSSASRSRDHYFSLEQLHPPAGVDVLVASVFVEDSNGGLSLVDLVDRIRATVSDPDLVMSLDLRIASAMGHDWRTAAEERYDDKLAVQSLLFYEVGAVPSVPFDIPSGVSEVRFRSDLAFASPADLRRYRTRGGLFGSML